MYIESLGKQSGESPWTQQYFGQHDTVDGSEIWRSPPGMYKTNTVDGKTPTPPGYATLGNTNGMNYLSTVQDIF